MADIIVTREVLEDSVSKLGSISDELSHQQSADKDYKNVFGQKDVNKAMHDFAGDWKIHRGKIEKNVSDLHDKMQQSVDRWNEVDQDLHDKLSTEESQTS